MDNLGVCKWGDSITTNLFHPQSTTRMINKIQKVIKGRINTRSNNMWLRNYFLTHYIMILMGIWESKTWRFLNLTSPWTLEISKSPSLGIYVAETTLKTLNITSEWMVFMDGLSNVKGSRGWILIESDDGLSLEGIVRFDFLI